MTGFSRAPAAQTESADGAVAGDGLLHPVVLLAIALLLLNDHLLKQAWPGPITGKLSDFAGLIFFPLLLQAAWEVTTAAIGRPSLASQRVLIACIVASAVVFSALKTVPAVGDLYRSGLGVLQWLGSAAIAVVTAQDPGVPHTVAVVADTTDLFAVPALIIPYLLGRNRAARHQRPG